MAFTREETLTLRRLNVLILQESPFFGHIMASCRWDCCDEMPTVAGLKINSEFLTLLIGKAFFVMPFDQQKFVVVHELLHFLFKHPMRMQYKCDDLKNAAADLAVNSFILRSTRYLSSPYSLQPQNFGLYDNRTYEYYLKELMRLVKEGKIDIRIWCQCGADGKGRGGTGKASGVCPKCGGRIRAPGEGDGHYWKIEGTLDEASELARRLYNVAKSVGATPVGALRELYEAEARISWEELVINAAQTSEMAEEWRFCKRHCSRRYGTIPGVVHEYLGDMMITVDTSGSMSPKEVGACFNVIDKMAGLGYRITILEHDADFLREYPYEGIPPHVKGGGGTCICSTLQHIEEDYPNCTQVFCFTDGVIFDLDKARAVVERNDWDIVWILTQDQTMPYGRQILMEIGSEIEGM